ncbi:MAG: outer membrane lipoprotein-sorting protein [Candidatus Aminicenantes bacterium]|nr:outer membrane lipoprotein-sorting protein [Candidatus Aminicenantes bacterium]
MKAIKISTTVVLIISFCFVLSSQEKLTAKQIMDISFETMKLAGSEAVSTMTIIDNKGRERVRQIAMVTKLFNSGDTEKRLLRFLSPPDVKGTGLLVFDYKEKDDDMWLFMPALRKTRRIVSSERAKSFMGSEFSYADMAPPILDEFTYNILNETVAEGTPCWEIEMMPVNDNIAEKNGFSKRIAYIGKKDFVIRKAVYFDLDGELHKELAVKEIKELDTKNHKYRPLHMVMINKQNNRKSILKVDKIQFAPNVKDDYFTTRYLERY